MTDIPANFRLPAYFQLPARPQANPKAIVRAAQARFTLLTGRMIRMEFDPQEHFEERPSQIFWFREQPEPAFETRQEGEWLEIETEYLRLRYRAQQPFSAESLAVVLKESGATWHYGDAEQGNLRGTMHTLDNADGPVPLEPGLVSRAGWTLVDDSQGLVFNEAGWLEPRQAEGELRDLYFFGYGKAYQDCLSDFCRVSGPAGFVPRWALGNWWSRYWAYSAQELIDLMDDFRRNQVPLAVCITDMDWHITQTGNESSGWTGFTWNPELFPDPSAYLAELKRRGLKTALNLHPADGFYPHEALYSAMARRMGIDPASEKPVPFDLENPEFVQAYLDLFLHPEEEAGVDFWWMDWQQGNPARMPGLNLLWWINHLHYMDSGRNPEKRPFIFSRWGGLGNHRYPIGFSGDTYITWESLQFQPYLTATAANVGYGWWSHDIGGHMRGTEEPELYTRWVQFGVFSPITRLHSTNNPFHERRPWAYDAETLRITRDALQLRQRLIPYIYSMAWRDHTEGISLVRPMYYQHPEAEAAYACPDQYSFGSELLAAPFTSPGDKHTRLSRQVFWLPPGEWFDFFDGEYVEGDAWSAEYGRLEDIPVYARAGAIVPLGAHAGWDGIGNPEELEVVIFPGAENRFELYEDDGTSQLYQKHAYAITPMELKLDGESLTFSIAPVEGFLGAIPEIRTYRLVFRGVRAPELLTANLNGQSLPLESSYEDERSELALRPVSLRPTDRLEVMLVGEAEGLVQRESRMQDKLMEMLRAFHLNSQAKESLAARMDEWSADPQKLDVFQLDLAPAQMRALLETLTGSGVSSSHSTGYAQWILWNNTAAHDISYQLSIRHMRGFTPKDRYELEKGTAPKFRAWRPEEDFMGKQAQLALSYGSLLQIRLPWPDLPA